MTEYKYIQWIRI